MFDAMLKKDNDPLSAAEIVEFPIPEAQYEETIRALNGIQSGAVVEQDCFVADIGTAGCPALERLIGTMANVDELDWLGKQLESFDRYELLQFNAAVERFGLSAADELIDLSFCAREVTVVSDFNDLELVGKRHYLIVHGACDPKELEDLDGKEMALTLISGQHGYVTRYMIQQSGHYEYDENLEDFYIYGDYGAKRMLQEDGVFMDRGYVSYHGTLTLDELMRDDPAESYQQEQDVRMEGMAW